MLSFPDFNYKQIAIHIAGGSGERLRFRADNIFIQDKEEKVLFQHSCHKMFALFIIGEVSLTSVAIRKSSAFSFPIILMNRNLRVYTKINCAAEGNTLLRFRQYTDKARATRTAQELISQKLNNQAALLQSLRYRSEKDKEAEKFIKSLRPRDVNGTRELMGLEGVASHLFFETYFRPLGWTRREPRCKRDIYNLLLDIGYTYLFHFVEAMLSLYGFDLYCGVLHTFFYHRKSLVCDIVEPFRCIIDRRLRKAYNLRQINPEDFSLDNHQYRLNWGKQEHYSKLFLKDILENKEAIFRFCQAYYRWVMQEKPIEEFPKFEIKPQE